MWKQLTRNALGALLIAVLAVPFAQAAGEAGFVLFATGGVTATGKDGASRDLKRRSPVYAGDLLRTAAGARAQVKFTDGGIVALKPGSALRLDDYAYQAGGTQTSVMSLVKGGFRTMTGAIGKLNKADYKVNTPVATIGIRGTLYETWFDEGEGLSLGVWDGGITACNDSGCLDLGMNSDHRFGFVPVNGAARGQASEPDGIGSDDEGGTGTDTGQTGGALDGLVADPVADALQPDGLFGAASAPSRDAYPKVGYALVSGGGVVPADYATATVSADPLLDIQYVIDWSLVDSVSGVELSASPDYNCGGEQCSSWYAYNDETTGSQVVWGDWTRVDVGLGAGDPAPATSDSFGYFVTGDYVSPEAVNTFAAQTPVFYVGLYDSKFEMSGQPYYNATASGSMVIDFAANDVSGNLYVSDFYTYDSWSLAFSGTVSNGELDLALDTVGSVYTPFNATTGETSQVTGTIDATFFGNGTVEGVLGGVEASTVGANALTGNVETLQGIFQMNEVLP